MKEKTLYLIDGYAFAYRAHFALIRSPLVNSKGFPTSALYGFVNYMLRLLDSYGCPYLAVVMDSKTPTFRHEAYPQYKANRQAMPDDLKAQMPRIDDLLDALNIPVIRRDGFEADDIIASLTRKATAEGFDVFLVTKDKDLMQLIGNNVKMLAPDGFGVFSVIGADDVIDKMGVRPDQVLDYLSMVGDASDNIPGVPGIGPKNAAKILEDATVDAILKDPSILKPIKTAEKFMEYRDQLALSKMLATLRFDVELDFDMETLKRRNIDISRSQALLKEFEFFSLLKNPIFGLTAKFEPNLIIVDSIDKLRRLACRINAKKTFAVNVTVDTPISRAAKITGITIALDPSEAYHVQFKSEMRDGIDKKESLSILGEVIESANINKIGHNFKHLLQVFKRERLTLRGIQFDAMIASYVIDPGKRQPELHDIVNEYLGLDIKTDNKTDKNDKNNGAMMMDLWSTEEIDSNTVKATCATLLLANKLWPIIQERNCESLYNDIELPLEPVLADLEWQGVIVNTNTLTALSREYTEEISGLTEEIYALAGIEFNINSPKQLAKILFEKLGLPGGKKNKSGTQSTNIEILEKLADDYPIVRKIIEYREKQKLLSTYIDALPAQILPETGRVHTTFNQAVTATGRLSSTNPNLQNIPIRTESGKKIREAFVAPSGYVLIAADYSQIELRILAHLSSDPVLVQAFKDGMDIHTQTASAVYGIFPEMVTPEMRRAAKTINFGLMYGMGHVNLSKQLGVSFSEAKAFIESYFNRFPSIQKYMETSIRLGRDLGYAETLLGRRRYLPDMNSSNRNVREAAERTAINTPVQGTAADIIKLAMIRVHQKSCDWPEAKMLLQVHDELVFEVPEESANDFARWVRDEMSAAYQLKVPLTVDVGIGRHWGDAH